MHFSLRCFAWPGKKPVSRLIFSEAEQLLLRGSSTPLKSSTITDSATPDLFLWQGLADHVCSPHRLDGWLKRFCLHQKPRALGCHRPQAITALHTRLEQAGIPPRRAFSHLHCAHPLSVQAEPQFQVLGTLGWFEPPRHRR